LEKVSPVGFDGFDADVEPIGDFLVAVAFGQPAQDFVLATGECGTGGSRQAVGDSIQELPLWSLFENVGVGTGLEG